MNRFICETLSSGFAPWPETARKACAAKDTLPDAILTT